MIDDERVEQWAQKIYDAWRWGANRWTYDAARALVVMADAEQADLRAELAELRAAVEELRQEEGWVDWKRGSTETTEETLTSIRDRADTLPGGPI